MRLIDADELVERISAPMTLTGARAWGGVLREALMAYRKAVLWIVDSTPTIEAEPVQHATYDEGGDCTNCGYPMPSDDRFDAISPDEIKYCYNCGAKMDGGESHETD